MKIRTKLDKRMQKELNKPLFMLAYAFFAVGIVWLLIFVVGKMLHYRFDHLFLWGLGLFIVPGALIYIYKKNVFALGDGTKENEYEFFDDYFNVTTLYHNKEIGTSKVCYTEVSKTKETKSYFFVYLNYASAYPISKDGLNDEELQKLRALFHVNTKERRDEKNN